MKALNRAIGLIFLLMISCAKPEEKRAALFELMPSEETGVQFINSVENSADFNLVQLSEFLQWRRCIDRRHQQRWFARYLFHQQHG